MNNEKEKQQKGINYLRKKNYKNKMKKEKFPKRKKSKVYIN